MKTKIAFALVLLVSIAGCGGSKKKKVEQKPKSTQKEVFTQVDIPVSGDDIQAFFDDEDIQDFVQSDKTAASDDALDVAQLFDLQDQNWKEVPQESFFKTVYFDFDSDVIRHDQDQSIAHNVELIKKKMKEQERTGNRAEMTIVVDGHSCNSAGSSVYNLALSERRAKRLKDRLVSAGVPADCIKIVGRGNEIPAIVDGKPVDGDRQAQWPNRRDEIRIIYA